MPSRILVVDDSPMDRRAVAAILMASMEDVETEFAESVDEALAKIEADPPLLVVTDLIMPERDGFELVAKVVAEHPMIPVILITGEGSEEVAVRALQAGASSYVAKAVLQDRLVETVSHVMAVAQEEKSQIQLMGSLTRSDTEFELENDPLLIPALVNFLHRSIRTVGLCDEIEGIRVCVALEEAINNALFHGNLEISSELREGDLGAYRRLIEERRQSEPYSSRKIRVEATLTRIRGVFRIQDEGPGFDPGSLPDPTEPAQLERASGRGLLLIRTFMDDVAFNDSGNEIMLVKENREVAVGV